MTAFRWTLVLPLLFLVTGPASAQEMGTAAEAKAMLEKVVADVKASKAKALQDITAGTYNKKDLYPFCGGPDGKFTAHGANKSLVGQSLKDLKDKSGKAFGEEIYKEAKRARLPRSPIRGRARMKPTRCRKSPTSRRSATRFAASATTNSLAEFGSAPRPSGGASFCSERIDVDSSLEPGLSGIHSRLTPIRETRTLMTVPRGALVRG